MEEEIEEGGATHVDVAAEGAEMAGGVETAAGACVDSGGYAIGMPQLCGEWIPNQVFWLLVTLVVIYYVLSRIALPRIAAVLAERQGAVTNDVAAAEELKQKAADAEAAYDKALADARSESNRIAEETRAQVQSDLDAELARADERIAAKMRESEAQIAEIRSQATESVREVAREVGREIVAALGTGVDPAAAEAEVDNRMRRASA